MTMLMKEEFIGVQLWFSSLFICSPALSSIHSPGLSSIHVFICFVGVVTDAKWDPGGVLNRKHGPSSSVSTLITAPQLQKCDGFDFERFFSIGTLGSLSQKNRN